MDGNRVRMSSGCEAIEGDGYARAQLIVGRWSNGYHYPQQSCSCRNLRPCGQRHSLHQLSRYFLTGLRLASVERRTQHDRKRSASGNFLGVNRLQEKHRQSDKTQRLHRNHPKSNYMESSFQHPW